MHLRSGNYSVGWRRARWSWGSRRLLYIHRLLLLGMGLQFAIASFKMLYTAFTDSAHEHLVNIPIVKSADSYQITEIWSSVIPLEYQRAQSFHSPGHALVRPQLYNQVIEINVAGSLR